MSHYSGKGFLGFLCGVLWYVGILGYDGTHVQSLAAGPMFESIRNSFS